LICPDLKKEEGFFLRGDQASMISSIFELEINRCTKDILSGLKCKTPTEIEDYINDVQIDVW